MVLAIGLISKYHALISMGALESGITTAFINLLSIFAQQKQYFRVSSAVRGLSCILPS